MKQIASLILLLLVAHNLGAQESQAERIEAARRRTREFESLTQKLPEPPEPSLQGLPVPDLTLLRLAQEMRLFSDEMNDLDLAPGLRLMAARVLRSVGDPVGSLELARGALDHPMVIDAQRIAAMEFRAGVQAEGSGHAFATKEYEALLGLFPDNRLAAAWTKAGEEQTQLGAVKSKAAFELGAAMNSVDPSARGRADQALRRFLVANPLAPEAPSFLEGLLASLGEKADPAVQLPILERIAMFAPDSELWAMAAATSVQLLAREGEYEIALMIAQRMEMRASMFSNVQIEQLVQLRKSLTPLLARIAARDLELKPKTKRTRLTDLRRRARRGNDPEYLTELIQDFLADYPGASEAGELRLIEARMQETAAPERALALFKQVLGSEGGNSLGFEALRAAAPIAEKLEGAEAALALYATHAPAFSGQSNRAIPLAIEQAHLLDRLDRWEEARKLLEPWKTRAQGLDAQEIEKLDAALAAKMGG